MARNLVVALVLALVAACGDAGSDDPSVSMPSSEANAEAKSFKLGETVNFDAFEVTIKSVEESSRVGGAGFTANASDGGTLVAVTYALKNAGKEPLGMFDRPSLELVDSAGQSYDEDMNATISFAAAKSFDAKAMSDLNPGISTTNGAVWEVSKEDFEKNAWHVRLKGHDNAKLLLQ